MIPPTPTLIPPGTPVPIDFDLGMWQMSPNMIGLWNQFHDYTPILQTLLFVILLGILFWTVSILMKRVSEEEEAS